MSSVQYSLSSDLVPSLLDWYRQNGRPMPWSDHPDPWMVAVGVMMLQQTTVTAAIPYLHRFLKLFPTPAALADASEAEALHAWSGLGYYGRVRNLRRAAQVMVEKHAGELPSDFFALQMLPGFGDYSAGALASIAFDLPVPALDANGLRIIARLLLERDETHRVGTRRRLNEACAPLMPVNGSGLFNQALMDFGAMVCTARDPNCTECVLRSFCEARKQGAVQHVPVLKAARTPEAVEEVFAVLMGEGGYYIQQRASGELLEGFWQFPTARLVQGESVMQAATRAIQTELPAACAVEEIGRYRHSVLHYRISGHVVRCECPPEALRGLSLVPFEQLAEHPMASAMKKALKVLVKAANQA